MQLVHSRRYAGFFGAGVAASILVFAACGGDDTAASTAATSAAPATERAEPAATNPPGATSKSTPSAGGNATLEKLRKDLKSATFRATYDGKVAPASGQAIEGTYTLGAKASTTLFGVKGTIAGGQTTFLLIDDGTNTFTCIESSGQKQCLKSKSGSGGSLIGSLSVDGVIQSVSQDKTTTVTPVTGQTIAGTKANCFAVKGSGSDGTLCAADANGVLLLLDGTFSGNKVSLKATNVNINPADDDFKPPYTVSELAGGGGR